MGVEYWEIAIIAASLVSLCFAIRAEVLERIDKAAADITMLRAELDKLRKHMEGK